MPLEILGFGFRLLLLYLKIQLLTWNHLSKIDRCRSRNVHLKMWINRQRFRWVQNWPSQTFCKYLQRFPAFLSFEMMNDDRSFTSDSEKERSRSGKPKQRLSWDCNSITKFFSFTTWQRFWNLLEETGKCWKPKSNSNRISLN